MWLEAENCWPVTSPTCQTDALAIRCGAMKPQRRHFLHTASVLTGLAALGPVHRALAQPASPATDAAQESKAPPLPALGTPLALPEVALFDGSVFRPAQTEGKVTVIYWWASTCPFCALQSPEMQKLWNAHRQRGMQLLTLSIDKKPEAAVAYLKKKGYTFPAGWVTPEIRRNFPKPKGLPITLVRGRDGRIVQAERGQMFPEDVEQLAQHWAG